MSRIGGKPKKYMDDKYLAEALDCYFVFSPGAQSQGLKGPEHLQAFAEKQDAKGVPFGRMQKNRDADHLGIVDYLDSSFNRWYEQASASDRKKFWSEVWAYAVEDRFRAMDEITKARMGAGGKVLMDCEVIAHHAGHNQDRNGNTSIHGHTVNSKFGKTSDGQVRSVQGLVLHANITGLSYRFQLVVASRMETVFGVKIGMDNDKQMAFIHGLTRKAPPVRNDAAEAYLKDRGIKKTKLSMRYARQNTRPKKPVYTSTVKAAVVSTEKPEKLVGKSWWGEVYRDFILEPLKVIKFAYRHSGGRGIIHVNDVGKFLRDTDRVTLRRRHQAAAKALYAHQYPTFLQALDAARIAFKKAKKPKQKLARGARLVVKREDIKDEKQLAALNALSMRRGCTLNIIEPKQEQGQEQKQEQRRKR